MFMFVSSMLYELILTVVSYAAGIAQVRLLVCVSAFVVITITDSSKSFWTVLALIGFLSGVDAHMHQ